MENSNISGCSTKKNILQKDRCFSVRNYISESRINMVVCFSEKLRELVTNYGIEYLRQKAFINALADYQLFVNAMAYKNALLLMLENGLIDRLIALDYTHYKLELDRFCDEYAVQTEVIYCLAEAIAIAIDKTLSFQPEANSPYIESSTTPIIESNFFIPTNDGNFIPFTNIPRNVSFNDVAKILGHEPNQYYSYDPPYSTGIRDIIIMFESFTGNILYVYVNEKTKSLNSSKVKIALKEYSFTEEYDYSKYCHDIEEGIQKENLTKEFFKRLLNQDSDVMVDSRFNTKLIFKNDRLIKMESLDALSPAAKSFRDTNPMQYNRIKKYAESFNFLQELILKEINMQVDAYINMPLSLFDNFSEFYMEVNDEIWSTNYVMCAVAYARRQINLEDFKLISHEEYSKIGEFRSNGGLDFVAYLYLNQICFFDSKNGNFICCYKNGENLNQNSNINLYYIDKF